jgi:peptidoglycan/LPS O-acetylase OafA/YrhL
MNQINSLRLVLAVAVIWSHSFALGVGSEDKEPISLLAAGQVNAGNLAVFGFFALSGYLITDSWLRNPDPATFLKKRILRIYPGFLAATLCAAFFVVPLALHRPPGSLSVVPWRSVFAGAFLLQGFDVPNAFAGNALQAINGSLWSISYEFWCYIGVLILGMVGILSRSALPALVLCLTVAANEYLVHSGWLPGGKIFGLIFGAPFLWTRLLPYFLGGMILRLLRSRLPLRGRTALLCIAVLCFLRFLPRGLNVGLPFLGTYALLTFALSPRGRLPDLSPFGDLSYGSYLYAFPIQQLVVMSMGGHAAPLAVFGISTPLTLCAAAVSWHLVEKPALRLARSRAVSSRGASTAAPEDHGRVANEYALQPTKSTSAG